MFFLTKFYHRKTSDQSTVATDPQILDLLQWSCSEKEWREESLRAITNHRLWKRTAKRNLEPSLLAYSCIRGNILRRQAWSIIHCYRLIRRNRRTLFNHYLQNLPPVRA